MTASGSRLGSGPEFDLIRRLTAPDGPLPPHVRVGPGDDAAVLAGGWVVSSDLSVEGVHFRRDWLTLEEIGGRAVAAALSDLAAMAAEPGAVLLSLAVPDDADGRLAEALQQGAGAAAREAGTAIVGGDLSRSPGPIVLDVTVLGRTSSPVLRTGGRVGDELWVTGWLGGAAGAVHMWEGGGRPTPELREVFAHPRPRLGEARWLAERGLMVAALDLSDGLAGDASHLAASGGLRIVLREDDLPLHPELVSGDFSPGEARRLALEGGEDYELVFLARPGSVDGARDPFHEAFGVPLTRVGRAEEGSGVFLESGGGAGEVRPAGQGFSHFGERG